METGVTFSAGTLHQSARKCSMVSGKSWPYGEGKQLFYCDRATIYWSEYGADVVKKVDNVLIKRPIVRTVDVSMRKEGRASSRMQEQ